MTEERSIVSVADIDDAGHLLNELGETHVWDQAAESGEESAAGSAPAPDQDVVDEIGKSIGVTYQEGEPLRAGEKEEERDEHRWELDPASAEDYASRSHAFEPLAGTATMSRAGRTSASSPLPRRRTRS